MDFLLKSIWHKTDTGCLIYLFFDKTASIDLAQTDFYYFFKILK